MFFLVLLVNVIIHSVLTLIPKIQWPQRVTLMLAENFGAFGIIMRFRRVLSSVSYNIVFGTEENLTFLNLK